MAQHATPTPVGASTRRATPRGKTPPMLSGGLPVLGHAIEFGRDAFGLLHRARREGGDVVGFRLMHKPMYLLTGTEANEAFFRAPDEQLSAREPYSMMTPVFGKDVAYDAPPDKMAEQMQMLMPALRDRRMRTYGEIVAHEMDLSAQELGERGTTDFVSYCGKLTNFTSSHCLLGPDFRGKLTEEFSALYHDLEKGIHPIGYLNPYLPIPAFRQRDRARKRLQSLISGIVQERRRTHHEGEDFLQTLMDARYGDGTPMSDHEITGMLLASMFAGHHTSSVTTAWTMIELLRHPFYLARVLEQLDEVYGPEPDITFESLRKLTLIEYAIKEALRLHPPLFMLLRAALYDFEYDGYVIPKGSYLVVSPAVSHRIPSIFREPDRFDPDRFGPDRQEDKNKFNYISFGGGRHKCLGNAFALLQIKTIFAKLLTQYEFELAGDPIETDFSGVVIGPKAPIRVHYRRRRDRP
ncbi:MAG: cytochrome P450 [Myxococcota bacterium]